MPDKTTFGPPRGMRDFYPDEMAWRNRLFDSWTTAARRFGFQQYDACVVESLDLLKRKAGEEIVDQIYSFTDKSGRDLALRPEMTPTLARMIGARQGSLAFPLKWFAIAQCFRYERMSRGRKREHYQWNLDVVGEESPCAEAEVLAAAVDALSGLGLGRETYNIRFSSRALLSDLLSAIEIPCDRHPVVFPALDKIGKLPVDEIRKMLEQAGLASGTIRGIFDLLNVSTPDELRRYLGEETKSYANVKEFIGLLDAYGIQNVVKFDLSIVRGLAYYTGIVFEAFDTNRDFRAIFGGGRYDNLLADMGGKSMPCVGLGFGDVVVCELLMKQGSLATTRPEPRTAVGYMSVDQRTVAIRVANMLRRQELCVDMALSSEKAKNFFSRCDKSGFTEAVYIGPDDVAAGSVRVKDLATRTERALQLNA